MNVDGQTLLENLSAIRQSELVHKLNREDVCNRIADYCHLGEPFGFDLTSTNSGQAFYGELCAKKFTVFELCEALERCDLSDISALFKKPVPLQIESIPIVLSEARSSKRDNGRCNKLYIKEGTELRLKAKGEGIPPPKYEWYCDNSLISSNSTGLLVIQTFHKENEGRYCCKISQEQENINVSKMTEDVVIMLDRKLEKNAPKLSAKKALLIANQSYEFDELSAPVSDTDRLRSVLETIYDFEVTVLENLRGQEMKEAVEEFWKGVPELAYVLFYFAGHGFQVKNDLYLMGVDKVRPSDFGYEHAMSDEMVVQLGSTRKPSLLLMLCDTCLSQLQDGEVVAINKQTPPEYDYAQYPGVIRGYPTSKNCAAYEDNKTGLFTKHLIKVLESQTDLTVSEVLVKVRKGVNKETNKYGDVKLQVPMEVNTATRAHRLSDPVHKRKKTRDPNTEEREQKRTGT